ncbi:MAG: hypothetical protein KJ749_12590, partial [Planctomycetes bacterium]|nr:hypothetical protein [Planctomycetota bacterium]
MACILAACFTAGAGAPGSAAAADQPQIVDSDSPRTILADEVLPDNLIPLPEVMRVREYYPDGTPASPTAAVAATCEKLVYSSTFGQHLFRPGSGIRVADDLVTEAIANLENACFFGTLRVRVNGGVEEGDGEFNTVVSLWNGCPNGGGVMIPGTRKLFSGLPDDSEEFPELVIDFTDHGICANSAVCSVAGQNCADLSICVEYPIVMPSTVWLQVSFNTATAGIVYGSPAQRGFSADNFDHPGAPCFSWFGGYPLRQHATFWAEICSNAECPVHFLAYMAADPSRRAYIPPTDCAQTRIGDDIELILGDGICELSAYELGIKGSSGKYEMDMDLRWPDLFTVQEATHAVFTGRGLGSLEIAHVDVPAGLFIGENDQPIFITWQPNRGGTGVPLVYQTQAGESGPTFVMRPPGGDWEEFAIGVSYPAVFYASIFCRG